MATDAAETLYTPDDLLRMTDGPRRELIDGRLVEKPMGARSSLIAVTLAPVLGPFIRSRGLGRLFGSDCGYQIFLNHPNRVRFPDLSFIARGRLPNEEVPGGHVRVAPDLAVEVVSPNDLACDVHEKVAEYLAAGVGVVW